MLVATATPAASCRLQLQLRRLHALHLQFLALWDGNMAIRWMLDSGCWILDGRWACLAKPAVACRGVVYGNILSNLLPLSFGSIIGNALASTHKSALKEKKFI